MQKERRGKQRGDEKSTVSCLRLSKGLTGREIDHWSMTAQHDFMLSHSMASVEWAPWCKSWTAHSQPAYLAANPLFSSDRSTYVLAMTPMHCPWLLLTLMRRYYTASYFCSLISGQEQHLCKRCLLVMWRTRLPPAQFMEVVSPVSLDWDKQVRRVRELNE